MKKYLLSFAVLLMGAALFTACNDDNDGPYYPFPVVESDGMYVVCTGNKSASIDGSLSYYNYSTGQMTLNAFSSVNARPLGLTPNDLLVHGSKVYIVVNGEHTIEVADAKTLRSLKQIKTTDLLGNDNGHDPRCLTAYGDRVYFSTYGGVVAAIDTINYELQDTYEAGSYPEDIMIVNGYLYVANSDYGKNTDPSISRINLRTGEDSKIENSLITNPQKFYYANGNVYFLDYGTYDSSWNQLGAGVRQVFPNGKVVKAFDATAADQYGDVFFFYNAPYKSKPDDFEITYGTYSATSGVKTLNLEGLFSPAAIGVDPVNGYLFVASLTKNEDTEKPNYRANGYVNQYALDGSLVKSNIPCGTGPTAICFNIGIKYE